MCLGTASYEGLSQRGLLWLTQVWERSGPIKNGRGATRRATQPGLFMNAVVRRSIPKPAGQEARTM